MHYSSFLALGISLFGAIAGAAPVADGAPTVAAAPELEKRSDCLLNAREAFAYHRSGQQYRRCYFSMENSTTGTPQYFTDPQTQATKLVSWEDGIFGYQFMVNQLTKDTNVIGRTGGPWCTNYRDDNDQYAPHQGYCTTGWYNGAAATANSGNACQEALISWRKTLGCYA